MHIAFLTPEYPIGPCGGIGTSVRNLGQALSKRGHRVTVLGWGRRADLEDEGVRVRFLAATRLPRLGWFANRLAARRELNRMAAQESLQIVEAADWCGMSAGIQPTCPVVIRCHGSAAYFAHLLNEKVRPSVRAAERLALSQAAGIVAVSAFTARQTTELFGIDRQVGVIPNGIDLSQFAATPGSEWGTETVLYFGTLVRKKGVLDLPAIFYRLWKLRPGARLVLVGRDAPDRATGAPSTWELLRSAVPPAAHAKIEYLGPKPYAGIQEYVRKAALCAFPSYAEAFPLAWLEAMACAKPIVAYDIGWAPETIESGTSGILVEAGDTEAFARALADLMAAPEKAKLLGCAARCRVEERFSSNIVAQQTLDWYAKLVPTGEWIAS